MAVWEAVCAVALLQPASVPEPQSGPPEPQGPSVQRPSSMQPDDVAEPTRAPAPQPDDVADPESDEVVLPDSDAAPEDVVRAPLEQPPASAAAGGRIRGTITDTEVDGAPIAGAGIQIVCECLEQPVFTSTDVDGRFEVDGLPPGVYTVVADRGGRPTRRTVGLGVDEAEILALQVGPPIDTLELERREYERARANTLISLGGVAGVAAVLLFVGAGVENAKPDCNFGLDDCADAPRREVTIGLGVAGGILAASSAALIGVGVHRLRRVQARVAFDDRSAALVLRGRF